MVSVLIIIGLLWVGLVHTVSRVLFELCSIWLLSVHHFILCLIATLGWLAATGGWQGVGKILGQLCSPIMKDTYILYIDGPLG